MADSDAMRNEIVSARITSLPKTVGDPLPEVWASFQDGGKKRVPGIEADAGNPAQEKEASMYAMTSYFSMPEDTDWDEMRRLAQERAVPYQSVPGMRSKAFIVDTERGLYGANYVWESKQAADEFLESELFRGIVERLGQPDLHVMEVPAYLEEGEIVFLSEKH